MAQRVLVTAGGNGIGLAIARAYAAEGARVHIADVNAEAVEAVTAANQNITGSVTDISDPAAVDTLFADVRSELGGLDVLINNAGISGPTAPVEELGFDSWNAVVNVNLNGTFHVTQRAIPLLKDSDAASVVTMSSLAGRFGYPNRIAYSTTKWALVGFSKTLAIELGEYGITSNTIHPGAVAGARMTAVLEGRAKVNGTTVEEETANALNNQSVKRFVDPAEIAALVLFLTGPHARSISGQLFPIDGDSKASA